MLSARLVVFSRRMITMCTATVSCRLCCTQNMFVSCCITVRVRPSLVHRALQLLRSHGIRLEAS